MFSVFYYIVSSLRNYVTAFSFSVFDISWRCCVVFLLLCSIHFSLSFLNSLVFLFHCLFSLVCFCFSVGRAEPSVGVGDHCAGCNKPILDKFLLNVCERRWHTSCVRCCDCLTLLTEKCFSRDAQLYCKKDFFRWVTPFCDANFEFSFKVNHKSHRIPSAPWLTCVLLLFFSFFFSLPPHPHPRVNK